MDVWRGYKPGVTVERFALSQETRSNYRPKGLGFEPLLRLGHYDQIRNDVAFRKEVANACGVGFDTPATLVLFEPNEPKNKTGAKTEAAVKRTHNKMVGAGGFEPPTSWSRTEESENPKSFRWYRIGTETSFLGTSQLNLS